MTSSHPLILVLWGQGFDEIAASIFVGELRRLGKRVKLVGLNSQQCAGQHGITLVPDFPLGQALRAANRIQAIIVPAPLAALQQFSYDPRLAELLGLATSNQAVVVVGALPADNFRLGIPAFDTSHLDTSHLDNVNLLLLSPPQLVEYPPLDELLPFVQRELLSLLPSDASRG